MDHLLPILLAIVAAYLAGSIPFGYLIVRLAAKIDIRKEGSGNIGATNVSRVLREKGKSPIWGRSAFLLDLLKGMLPVWLLPLCLLPSESPAKPHLAVFCGIAAILGHMFPCWLGFRGGKGVATALGVVLVLSPWGTLVAASVFVVSFAIWRIVSLGSILAVTSFALFQIIRTRAGLFSADQWSLSIFSLAIPLLIIYQHRANIGRLLRGEEKKFK